MRNSYKTVITSGFSAIFYGFWGSFIALGLKQGATPSNSGLIVYSSAIIFSLLISRGRISRPEPLWLISGLLFSLANFILFFSMKLTQLSSAYAFVPASILVFFILTGLEYKVNRHQSKRALISALVIVVGLIVAEIGNGMRFNIFAITLGFLISVLYGSATYIMIKGVQEEIFPRNFWIMVTETVFFLAVSLRLGQAVIPGSWSVLMLAGLAVSVGLTLELSSFRYATEEVKSFYAVNLANVISNFDTVFIAIASIIIGSYSVYGIFGLVMVFLGAASMY